MVLSSVSHSDSPYVGSTGWAFPLCLLPMAAASSHPPTQPLSLWCIWLFIAICFSCLEKFHDMWLVREMLLPLHLSFQSHHFKALQAFHQQHLRPLPLLYSPALPKWCKNLLCSQVTNGSVGWQSGREASLRGEGRAQESWSGLSMTWVLLSPGPSSVVTGTKKLGCSGKCLCI